MYGNKIDYEIFRGRDFEIYELLALYCQYFSIWQRAELHLEALKFSNSIPRQVNNSITFPLIPCPTKESH